ncbi:hypothetical protein POTOM_059480 [Populus tomentosa]|uniref:Glucosidase II beta subunit N-terminal domain-containing protein n=1 Tax=Populus tomentosa TaxID=118781 RepID=A0A8X7XPK9_POPTO|nr:hypothetical protein POTOM_059480 [Populus tomentosa]
MEITPQCTNFNNLIPFIISLYFLGSSVQSLSPLLGIHPLDEKYFGSQVIKCKDGSKSFSRDRLNDNFCDCLDGTDEPGTSACPSGKFYCRNAGSTPKFIFSSRVNDQICGKKRSGTAFFGFRSQSNYHFVRHSSESLLLMDYLPCQYTRHDYDCQFLQLYDLLARIASYFHGLLKNSDGVSHGGGTVLGFPFFFVLLLLIIGFGSNGLACIQVIKIRVALLNCCDGSDEYGSGINCPNTCVMGGDLEYKAGNYISHIDMKESKRGLILEELFQKARGIFSNETPKIIPRCSENNVTNELVLVLTRIEGDNHPTGGYPSLCSDLQNILSSDQVQKKTLPLKKTTTMPHKLSPVP